MCPLIFIFGKNLPLSVQVSIYSNTEFCPNVLCPFRCLYIDIGGLGQIKTRVSAYFYFLKKFAFVRSGVYIYEYRILPKCPLSVQVSIYRHTIFGTNAFLTQNFTQDRRPNGRLLAPTPLTLRGEDLLRKSKDALLRIAKNSTCYAR